MWIWLIISIAVRVPLVAILIGAYVTMIIRNKHGFTEANPAVNYIMTIVIAGTLLYGFHFILPV